jgi:hypothetical protein
MIQLNGVPLNANNQRIYDSTGELQLGTAATTTHSLVTGDVIIGGKAEIQDTVYIDSGSAVDYSEFLALDHNGTDGYIWTGKGSLHIAAQDSNVLLTNNAGDDFGLLQFGGTSSSYPALMRNTTSLSLRYADDSGFADLYADAFYGTSTVRAGAASWFQWTGRAHFASPVDGDVILTNNAGNQGVEFNTSTTDNELALWNEADGYIALQVNGPMYSALPATLNVTGHDVNINFAEGNSRVIDLDNSTANITVSLSNPKNGSSYLIKIIQGNPVRTVTWPSNVAWEGGAAPVITAVADAVDIITLWYDGADYWCSYLQNLS